MKNEIKNLHASLFATGFWETHGCYCDDKGKHTWAEGQTEIFHRAKHWYAKNSLSLSNSKTIETSYEVEAAGADTANWASYDSLFKECRGRFQIEGNLILSSFSSNDGQFSGYEILRKKSDSHYSSFGEVYLHDHRHSSWSLELRKKTVVNAQHYWLGFFSGRTQPN